jgi:hypothetical protein
MIRLPRSCALLCLSVSLLCACGASGAILRNGDAGATDAAVDAGATSLPADAGAAEASCTADDAGILFTFTIASSSPFCTPSSCSDWISIRAAGGASVALADPCETSCSDCQPVGCPGGCGTFIDPVTSPLTRSWNGGFYEPGTCGTGLTCVSPACALGGQYVATMCVAPPGDAGTCEPNGTGSCVEVPFAWPPSVAGQVVKGVIPF